MRKGSLPWVDPYAVSPNGQKLPAIEYDNLAAVHPLTLRLNWAAVLKK